MDAGGKRKYNENAFTAKAENGTLTVKIMRREKQRMARGHPAAWQSQPHTLLHQSSSNSDYNGEFSASSETVTSEAPVEEHYSPPKPRPNRKHVPIFYQKKTTLSDLSASRSTDDIPIQTSSTSSTQDTEGFTGTQRDGGLSSLPNPLFSRSDSDGNGLLGKYLETQYSQGESSHQMSFSNVIAHEHDPATALHQLAASSAAFGNSHPLHSSLQHMPSLQEQSSASNSEYRFNAFSALQSVIHSQLAQASDSGSSASLGGNSHHFPPPPRFNQLQRSGQEHSYGYEQPSHDDTVIGGDDDGDDLGPPPSAPPAFTVQNSLMGGGIEMAPAVSNVNTRNFDWSKHHPGGRPRSGSLPSIPSALSAEDEQDEVEGAPPHATSGHSNSGSQVWKEV
ncbi:TPA: hypothetical protein N0F65_008412 [Lagenidium giganteum]|uniref:Uncharacterized protein n=1 Tax=Lagenidium giganteum TaxID=4803 RepID=A0AAV2YWT5_9STRA|nr:TPA: hypothetical protein N0F65_008412 [Lagenidium giganteum]